MSKKIKAVIAALLILCIVFSAVFFAGISKKLTSVKYDIDTEKLKGNIRIAFISDLHSCNYGKNMELLINEIDSQKPDIILLGGDLFNYSDDDENAEKFLCGISGRYPCYYATGNHEFWSGEELYLRKMEKLKKYEITRLSGESAVFEINGEKINICGVDDPDAMEYTSTIKTSFEQQLQEVNNSSRNGYYTILLSHRPEKFDTYTKYNLDLVLSGHAHGGQWRIPFILNGLYAPHQGFFPKYTGGEYEESGTKMIVSRGLAKETTHVPRVYNPLEIVIIDLH